MISVRLSNQPVPIYTTIVRASSSFTPYKPTKQKKYDDKPSLLTGFGTRLKNRLLGKDKERLLGGRSPAPLNLNYPNKKGIDDFHVYTNLDQLSVELVPLVKEHAKVSIYFSSIFKFLFRNSQRSTRCEFGAIIRIIWMVQLAPFIIKCQSNTTSRLRR